MDGQRTGLTDQGAYTFTNFRVRPGPFVQILYDIVHKHKKISVNSGELGGQRGI